MKRRRGWESFPKGNTKRARIWSLLRTSILAKIDVKLLRGSQASQKLWNHQLSCSRRNFTPIKAQVVFSRPFVQQTSTLKWTEAWRETKTLFIVTSDLAKKLKDADQTVGVAESIMTGGVVGAVTATSSTIEVFRRRVVSYARPLRERC
ncbi:hypothetical protein V8C35DRAFT_312226 [Trichoderma chlorosporum]